MLDEREAGLVVATSDGIASAGAEVTVTGRAELPDSQGGAVLDAADASVESGDGVELLEAAEYPCRAASGGAGGCVLPEGRCGEVQALELTGGQEAESFQVGQYPNVAVGEVAVEGADRGRLHEAPPFSDP